MPPQVKGPKDIERLLSLLSDTAKRGGWARKWYENSAKEIVRLAGGDKEKADQIAQLLAIYSPQQPILGYTSLAVRAWNEFLTTGKVASVGTKDQINKANQVLVEKVPWEGRKTNNFHQLPREHRPGEVRAALASARLVTKSPPTCGWHAPSAMRETPSPMDATT